MVIFDRLKKPRNREERLELELRVNDLKWDLSTGKISYEFKLTLPQEGNAILSMNKGLTASKIDGVKKYKTRKVVESDLRWATVNLVLLKDAEKHVSGTVEGVPEDFTLSRLGIRYNRVVLSGELLWHPIIGRGVVKWGTRGHVRKYSVHTNQKKNVIGPGALVERDNGLTFMGEPRLRNPGITIIGGVYSFERDAYRIGVAKLGKIDVDDGLKLLDNINNVLSEVGDALSIPTPEYNVLALVWDDIEPFACDDMLVLRISVGRGLVKKNRLALYEALYTSSVHMAYNTPLKDLRDYWLYELIPGLLSLYILNRMFGREAVKAAEKRLSECIQAAGGSSKLPSPSTISVPRDPKQHASISCLAPLKTWEILKSSDPGALGPLLRCMLEKEHISNSSFTSCVSEVVGKKGNLIIESLQI